MWSQYWTWSRTSSRAMAVHRQVSIKDFCEPLPITPLRSPASKRSKLDTNTSELPFGGSEEESLPETDSDSEQEESVSPESGQCSSECCADELSEPYHPRIDFALTRRKQGSKAGLSAAVGSRITNGCRFVRCIRRPSAFIAVVHCRRVCSHGAKRLTVLSSQRALTTGKRPRNDSRLTSAVKLITRHALSVGLSKNHQ